MCQASKLEATDDIEKIVQVGDEIEIGDPLIVFGLGDTGDKAVDSFLNAFRDAGSSLDTAKRIVRSKHAGVVKDIRIYTNRPLDRLSPSLRRTVSYPSGRRRMNEFVVMFLLKYTLNIVMMYLLEINVLFMLHQNKSSLKLFLKD